MNCQNDLHDNLFYEFIIIACFVVYITHIILVITFRAGARFVLFYFGVLVFKEELLTKSTIH